MLADVYFADGKKPQAERVLQEVASTSVNGPDALRSKTTLARYAISGGQTGRAQSLVDEVLKADAANSDALVVRATLESARGDNVSAINDLRAVLRDVPGSKTAMVMLARAYAGTGETELGGEFYQHAVDTDPDDVALRVEYARLLIGMAQTDAAELQLAEALDRAPGFAPAVLARIGLLAAEHRWTEAEAATHSLIANAQTASVGHAALGEVLLAEQKFTVAIPELKSAFGGLANVPEVRGALALAYIGAGDHASALGVPQSLIAHDPKDALAYALLGDVQRQLKNLTAAEGCLSNQRRARPGAHGFPPVPSLAS